MKTEDTKFPVGMRVLVVDDDPTCLKLMEGLLLKCQYNVTTTSQAKEALKMLKKNRNMFDLVITDVHMPDMDGFKLLHILALEMDLPVIMLSAYGEPKLVMTGIKYGACDYLLKPVRIQELQNIWQHVVRRNKTAMSTRTQLSGNTVKKHNERSIEDDQEKNTGSDYNDLDLDGEELEADENENESESQDPTTQKKPRLFWSPELHQKFVDAVNQLSLEKAFPKKILDLMNVEGLTREQVASHLQKYRVYLRKMNTAASTRATASRVGNSEDVQIGSLGGGYGVFRSLAGSSSGSFLGAPYPSLSHPPGPSYITANSGLSMRGLSSSAVYQRPQHLNSGFFQGQSSNIITASAPALAPALAPAPAPTLALPPVVENDPLDYFWQNHQPDDYILNSSALPTPPPDNQTLRKNNNNKNTEVPFSQFGVTPQTTVQQIQKCNTNSMSPIFDENYLLDDDPKLFSSSQNSCEYLEDIVGRFLTQETSGIQVPVAEEEINLDRSFADY